MRLTVFWQRMADHFGAGYADTFARDHLPPPRQLPEFLFDLPELHFPDRLNCVAAFVDDWVAAGRIPHTKVGVQIISTRSAIRERFLDAIK